ncbi:preprotein translocase subunit SecE [Aerococcaceae bacterium zg-ZUI334]|uniref:preprotein translocase subunit SecE n=1 Tax=Aerococcaceae bacterium zg-252 TaxID=2796928 RepID=UPI001B940C40|nr:preprotein translocase subunit SecE [Aerococcaceae bacterium zg-ZUI334]
MGYVKGVIQELKKVTWPNVREINRFTWTVIVMVILFGLYFGAADVSFASIINWILSL